jgi:hypothetical protein
VLFRTGASGRKSVGDFLTAEIAVFPFVTDWLRLLTRIPSEDGHGLE